MGTVVKLPQRRNRPQPAPPAPTAPVAAAGPSLARRLAHGGSRLARFLVFVVSRLAAGSAATLLRLLSRPVRFAAQLGLIAFLFSIVIEHFAHWREPRIVAWTGGITVALILVHTIFEGIAGALGRLQRQENHL